MEKPLVSILIPVYNGSDYVKEAIDSALAQTYTNTEIIVINDGSSDGGATEQIILSYGDKIRYIKKENGGVSSALNAGIGAMNGEYVSWLSHDDVYTPTKVETQVDLLCSLKEKNVIAMCANRQIDKNSDEIGNPRYTSLPVSEIIPWQRSLMHLIDHSCNGCTLLIPKTVFDTCGGFNEDLRYTQDLLMWMTIFLAGFSLIYHKDIGVLARVHDRQLTQTGRSLYLHDSTLVGEILLPKLLEISTPESNFLYRFAKTLAIHGNRGIADKYIKNARPARVLSSIQCMSLRMWCLYGTLRPMLRKVYYRLVKNVRVQ